MNKTKAIEGAAAATAVSTNTTREKKSLSTYASKADLYKARTDADAIPLAIDTGHGAAKCYTWLPSFKALDTLLEGNKTDSHAHFNEIIPDTTGHPCYLFADLDRHLSDAADAHIQENMAAYFDTLIATFLATFQTFVKAVYGKDVNLALGKNTQVAYSLQRTKLSAHVKVNLRFPNVQALARVMHLFDLFLLSSHVSPATRDMFYFYKYDGNGTRSYEPIIDRIVYTNFRCMRIIYSRKSNPKPPALPLPLLPYGASSTSIKDHLVLVYDGNPQPVIDVTLDQPISAILPDLSIRDQFQITSMYKTKHQTQDQTSHPQRDIPRKTIMQLEDMLCKSEAIADLFKTRALRFQYNTEFGESKYQFCVAPRCQACCPYANRVHRNNRSYLEYDHSRHTLAVKCFDDRCKEAIRTDASIMFRLSPGFDTLYRFAQLSNTCTLHDNQDIVSWNEQYAEETMRSYPLLPIVCVRGNMGSAKTQVLTTDFIATHVRAPDKCLFVTYQQVLSNKYYATLEAHGFINYLDRRTAREIRDDKVIICLDSLCKVRTENFDFVFIDEVLSVLLHFNSSLMKKAGTICSRFELLLLQARHIYLLDACVDHKLPFEFVRYLAAKRNQDPHWIRNTFIRPTNRQANIVTNTTRSLGKALQAKAILKVAQLLKAGRKVAVSSSTLSFTKMLHDHIGKNFPHTTAALYNSETDRATLMQHSLDLNAAWRELDCVIYSPTISAGMSFEEDHFDSLVAFLENSQNTPTIDLSIQQLFRVRRLSTGQMDIFVNNVVDAADSYLPLDDHGIETWMCKNISNLDPYLPEDNGLEVTVARYDPSTNSHRYDYDRDRLSYTILRGIIYNRFKSLSNYTNILKTILSDDYNIPVQVQPLEVTADLLKRSLQLEKDWARLKGTSEPAKDLQFSPEFVIDEDQHAHIKRLQESGAALTSLQKQQKWMYEALELWGVHPNKVDAAFFDRFVGPPTSKNVTAMRQKMWQGRRFMEMMEYASIEDSKAQLQRQLDDLVGCKEYDHNIDMYKSKITTHYKMLIEGQQLLQCLKGDAEYRTVLKNKEEIVLDNDDMERGIKQYVEMHDTRLWQTEVVDLFKISKSYDDESVVKNGQVRARFVKTILSCTFGLHFEHEYNGKRVADNVFFFIGATSWLDALNQYVLTGLYPRPTISCCVFEDGVPDAIDK